MLVEVGFSGSFLKERECLTVILHNRRVNMESNFHYPLAASFSRSWFVNESHPFAAASKFASVESVEKAEALAEELQMLYDLLPIPLKQISLELEITFKSEASCRSWLDDAIAGLRGMEKNEKGYVLPTSDIDRGLQLDDRWPTLAQFLSVDLLERDEQSAVELFRSCSSIEKVRKLVAEIHSVCPKMFFR